MPFISNGRVVVSNGRVVVSNGRVVVSKVLAVVSKVLAVVSKGRVAAAIVIAVAVSVELVYLFDAIGI